MDRETETVINRLMSDLKAAQDLSAYLAENNKKLRETLKEIADAYIPGVIGDGYTINQWLIKHHTILVNKARAALKEGE